MENKRKKAFLPLRLRDLRGKRSQEDLAGALGIPQSQYARYEGGESEPSPYVVVRLANELRVTTDYLLGLTDNPVEHIADGDLSPDERDVVMALRQGKYVVAMRIIAEKSESQP